MASPCDACDRLQLTENLNQKKVPKDQKFFFKALQKQKLEIDLGGNCKEEFTFDEANRKYLSRYFPALDKTVYCCPQVYEYEYPEEPSDVIKEAEDGSHAFSVGRDYGTLKRTRKGQLAEEMVIDQFWTMLKKYQIPSFIIHGYQWKAKYLKNLTKLFKSFQKLFPKEGEIDVLISIPGQCIIVMEVKAVSDVSEDRNILTGVVSKAFSQCGKTFDFLSMIISDLYDGGGSLQVPVIKTVALPNCERVSAERLYCKSCFTHIVTSDDLVNADVLFSWFQQLLKQCSSELKSSQHDLNSHEGLIGRLISPASLIQIRTIPDSIRRTVSQITSKDESDQTIWRQLNPSQLSVVLRQEKLLWITGVPGSGKTILGLYKADEIVSDWCASDGERQPLSSQVEERNTDRGDTSVKGCVLYVINGFSPLMDSSCLLETYRAKFKKLLTNKIDDTFKVFVEDCSYMVEHGRQCRLNDSQNLPDFIAKLQGKHAGKVLHIIIEESQMLLKQVDDEQFKKDWKDHVDDKRLGNVWIIQSPFITGTDSRRGSLPGFRTVYLDRIIRMSKQNVDFVNFLLDEKYKLDHAVTGNRPIIYRMKCICNDCCVDAPYQCIACYGMRILWMFHKFMVSSWFRKEVLDHHELALKDVVLISLNTDRIAKTMRIFEPLIPFSVNKYPEEGTNGVILSSVRHFTGCERSIVCVDLNSAFYGDCYRYKKYQMECLTRTLGQLVMLDGGCDSEKVLAKYAESVIRIQKAADNGDAEITEIEPSPTDMKTLKELYIKDLEHTKAELQELVAKAPISDGSLEIVNKAQSYIDKLTKIQNDAQVWLDGQKNT